MSPPSARTPRLLHSLRLQVRWGDMDALGHVNNAEYLRYFEQSRIARSLSGTGTDFDAS